MRLPRRSDPCNDKLRKHDKLKIRTIAIAPVLIFLRELLPKVLHYLLLLAGNFDL